MDAVTTYTLYTANVEKTRERLESDAIVQREVEYYKENIGNVKSSQELVDDSRLLNFALKAFGLEEMSYAKAFMKKVIDGAAEGEDLSFAERLNDTRYQDFAEAFDFSSFGEATTSFTRATDGVVEKYFEATVEEQAGNQNVGARLALYFERKAADVENPYSIIADGALYEVVRTAFSLPSAIAGSDIDKQAEIIEEKLDIEDLQDPEKVKEMTDRFLNVWDSQNSSTTAVSPIINLFSNTASLNLSTIASLQSFRNSG